MLGYYRILDNRMRLTKTKFGSKIKSQLQINCNPSQKESGKKTKFDYQIGFRFRLLTLWV